MTIHTFAILLLSTFGFLAFVGLCVLLIFLGRHSAKNNPKLAIICVDFGGSTKRIKAKFKQEVESGITYKFKKFNDVSTLEVPNGYGFNFEIDSHRRKIEVNSNFELITSQEKAVVLIPEYATLMRVLGLSNIGADAIKAIKSGKQSLSLLVIILIVVAVIGLGLIGYQLANRNKAKPIQPSANITQVVTTTITTTMSPPVGMPK